MFRQYRHLATDHSLKACVTVSDLLSVQRVLVMLTGRGHSVTRLEAEETGDGRWRLRIDCTADDDEADLLEARLQRLPSVVAVDLSRGASLAAAS